MHVWGCQSLSSWCDGDWLAQSEQLPLFSPLFQRDYRQLPSSGVKECSDCFQLFLEHFLARRSPGHSRVRGFFSQSRWFPMAARHASQSSLMPHSTSPCYAQLPLALPCLMLVLPYNAPSYWPCDASHAGGCPMPHARARAWYLTIGHQTPHPAPCPWQSRCRGGICQDLYFWFGRMGNWA